MKFREAKIAGGILERRFTIPKHVASSKMNKNELRAKIVKMGAPAMLRKAIRGNMRTTEAKILAGVIGRRIPSASSQVN